MKTFEQEIQSRISANRDNHALRSTAAEFFKNSIEAQYSYNFSWLGRPVIQYPQDMVAVQELIWSVKPDLIIETGIAHGGSLILSASLLALLDYTDAVVAGQLFDPKRSNRKVLGIDIDIRALNRSAIESHPLAHLIQMIQGSSIDGEVISKVHAVSQHFQKTLVFLDSNHTHDHVLAELEAYAPLVSPGSYCCVFDTVVEDLPDDRYPDRPWGKGNNPKTAVCEYRRRLKAEGRKANDGNPLHFEVDKIIENKLLITVAPDGYLKRVD